MIDRLRFTGIAAAVLLAAAPLPLLAQGAASVTATCKDGTDFSGASRSGACRGHGGVKAWGAPTTAAAAAAPAASSANPSYAAAGTSRTGSGISPAVPKSRGTGGAGQVWVNTSSKVYHCPGDRYYGKTKNGQYLSETDAKAAGDRPSGGKACS